MLSASVSLGAPSTRPGSPDDDKSETQRETAIEAGKLPAVAAQSPSQVLHLSVSADMLSAQLLLKDPLPMTQIDLPTPGVVATLQTFPAVGPHMGRSHGFSMLIRDFSPSGSMWVQTTVSSTDGRVQLSRDFESATVSGSTQLIQDAPPFPGERSQNMDPVRLIINRNNEVTQKNEVNLKLASATFVALCREHPAETQEYLRPLFHDLGQEAAVFSPNHEAIWQVLSDDWKADEALIKRVKEAIVKFDAEDFQERQSAARALHEIGEPAALTLMHLDRSKFSAAMNSGVDTFLAPYLPLSPEQAGRLGKDRDFLLDSQYADDLALRKLAGARLEKVTGRPIGFDPAADDDTRMAQIARVRQSPPTTSPR